MTKNIKGCYPALVTPLKDNKDPLNNPVNQDAMNQLIDYVIKGGVDGVLISGCTGHSCTLTWEEQINLMKNSIEHISNKVPILAGDGSNCTREAIQAAKEIEDLGIKTHLQISPYQNKPTQEGLYQHYAAIASKINGEIILYNVPGRTGKNIKPETTLRLAKEFSNIIAIKEASGNMEQIKNIIDNTTDMPFSVLSGDDGLTLDIIKAGGTGSVSVAANVDPTRTSNIVKLALENKFDEAKKINDQLLGLYDALFLETNPSPAHYALRKLNIPVGIPRLPLVDVTDDTKRKMDEVLKNLNLKI